jgi:hypothetical protein
VPESILVIAQLVFLVVIGVGQGQFGHLKDKNK